LNDKRLLQCLTMDIVIQDEIYSLMESKTKGAAMISRKDSAGPVPSEETVIAFMNAIVLKILVVDGESGKKIRFSWS